MLSVRQSGSSPWQNRANIVTKRILDGMWCLSVELKLPFHQWFFSHNSRPVEILFCCYSMPGHQIANFCTCHDKIATTLYCLMCTFFCNQLIRSWMGSNLNCQEIWIMMTKKQKQKKHWNVSLIQIVWRQDHCNLITGTQSFLEWSDVISLITGFCAKTLRIHACNSSKDLRCHSLPIVVDHTTLNWIQCMTLNIFKHCHLGYLNLKIYSPVKFHHSHVYQ